MYGVIIMSRVYKLNDKDFKNLVLSKKCYSDILRELGLTTKGGTSSKSLKKRIRELNIDISHFESGNFRAVNTNTIKLEEILR